MNFDLTEDQQMFAETAKQFSDTEFAPLAAKWDQEHIFPKDVIAKAGELGFCGLYSPEDVGGLALVVWIHRLFLSNYLWVVHQQQR